MKIKTKELTYGEACQLRSIKRKKPKKANYFFRWLMKIASKADLKVTNFTYNKIGMEQLGNGEPCLILMNHSSFIDLKIAATIFYDRPFNIVCTSDGFIGKEWLMYQLGCIPAKKFITDVSLVKDMMYTVKKLKSSVLMFPEASYSFDGTATPLPESIGKCVKLLKVPVVMVRTYGAFQRDPLYNNLQLRKVNVSADVEYLLSKEQVESMSARDINGVIKQKFTFDNFKWQQENQIKVDEPFRADYLNRVLYKCPACLTEGKMVGRGIHVFCDGCGKKYELTEYGEMKALEGKTEFKHIPDWFQWERECVLNEIVKDTYSLQTEVDIYMMVNMKCLYKVGSGVLTHTKNGFYLTGCDGQINFRQEPACSYSLYSDYYWYELGDMICVGDTDTLYYCFPKNGEDVAAKTRLATEELFKLTRH